MTDQFHPMLGVYLKQYQENPSSRIFAPLAELYRKSGMPEDAIAICREGLHLYPNFSAARVCLTRALFDLQRYAEVVSELEMIAKDIPENIVAQRLLAESYLMLGRIPEALLAYKMVLYLAPMDVDVAEIVREIPLSGFFECFLKIFFAAI